MSYDGMYHPPLVWPNELLPRYVKDKNGKRTEEIRMVRCRVTTTFVPGGGGTRIEELK